MKVPLNLDRLTTFSFVV